MLLFSSMSAHAAQPGTMRDQWLKTTRGTEAQDRASSAPELTARERAKARWSERGTEAGQARLVPEEHKLSPLRQAAKMRQEKHWNELTPEEQAKRKAAFQKRHLAR